MSGSSNSSAECITLVSSAQQLRSVRPSWRAFFAARVWSTVVKMATFNSSEPDSAVQISSNGAEQLHDYQGKPQFLTFMFSRKWKRKFFTSFFATVFQLSLKDLALLFDLVKKVDVSWLVNKQCFLTNFYQNLI